MIHPGKMRLSKRAAMLIKGKVGTANASKYTVALTEKAIKVAKSKKVLDKLHILTYESSLTPADCKKLKSAGYGSELVWLKKKKKKKVKTGN